MKFTLKSMLLLGLALSVAVPAGSADAKKKRKKPPKREKLRLSNLDSTFMGLKFGADEMSALKWAQTLFQHHYDPLIAKAQGVEKERLKLKVKKEVERVRDSVVTVKEGKTGYEMSIVGDEIGRVLGERLMIIDVGGKKHYLLFHEGKLWRYATAMPAKDKPFKDRVATYTRRVGPPAVERTTPEAFAGWLFKSMRLELRDERTMTGADTFTLTQRTLAKKRSKVAKAKAKKDDMAGLEDVIDKGAEGGADTSAADKELEAYEKARKKAKKKKKK